MAIQCFLAQVTLIFLCVSSTLFCNSIVKIDTTHKVYNYETPWQPPSQRKSSGSGCIIDGNRILTNAHVVADQSFISVKRADDTKIYPARVLFVAHDCDLALIEVNDKKFYEGCTPLEFGEFANMGDHISVKGFPIGGNELSTTEGIVSRIEVRTYAHSGFNILLTQIDAPINPGNSGGPVLKNKKIVGIATQGLSEGQNLGYMIPLPVIQRFLTEVKAGSYKGIPDAPIMLQKLENEDMRRFLKIPPSKGGMLIYKVVGSEESASEILKPMDVITAIDGNEIAENESYAWHNNIRLHPIHIIQEKFIGDIVTVDLIRDSKSLTVQIPLTKTIYEECIAQGRKYDTHPQYLIKGGVVFQPLTQNFLEIWGPDWYYIAPKNLLNHFLFDSKTLERDQIVIITQIIPYTNNQGYQQLECDVVNKVNGTKIKNLYHLDEVFTGLQSEFVEIEMESGRKMILDRQNMEKYHQEILDSFGIPFEKSIDFRNKNK